MEGEGQGYLVIKKPWPSTMRTVYGDHARFESTYFEKFPGYYLTGDGMCSLIILKLYSVLAV